MSRTRVLAVGAAAAVLALAGLAGPAGSEPSPRAGTASWHGGPAGGASGAAVLAWNTIAVDALTGLPGPAGGTPFGAQIHLAMVQGAVYDAVNATEPKHHRPYLLQRRFSARASQDAAVATAAYDVLRNIVSTIPASLLADSARASLLSTLGSHYATSLDAVPDGPFERQGVAAGAAAAAAMIAARADDGRFGPSPWVPSTAVGHWWPQTNASGQLVLDPTPWVGEVDPFLVQSATQFRTAGPLALTSAAYAQEYNEVKALGASDSAVRTPTQTYVARWWQSTPAKSWNEVTRDLAARSGLDAADAARLFAMSNLSAADASITCWKDKYHYDFWRPGNAITRAAEDGNPATAPQAGWTPLISAPYPEHPSGHLCLDGAHTRVLHEFFGDTIAGGYQITSISTFLTPTDPRTRTFGSFSQALAELVEARIWAGLHFRTADVQARAMGEAVADYADTHYFQRVGKSMRVKHHGSRHGWR